MNIVSCTPSTTDILILLGLGENIVGADDLSMEVPPNEHCLALGPIDNINVQVVSELEPDLVIATETVPGSEAVIHHLQAEGIRVLSLHSERLDDLVADAFTIGVECGEEEKARRLVEHLDELLKRITALVPASDQPLRVYFERYPDPFLTVGSQNWVTDMLDRAGAQNIFEDIPNPTFVPEEDAITDRDPEAIFICWYGQGDDLSDMETDPILKRKGWGDTTAVRRKQVYFLPESLYAFPGPKLLEGLEIMVEVVGQALASR